MAERRYAIPSPTISERRSSRPIKPPPVVWRAEYEPYGDIWTLRAGTPTDQLLRFPGQEYAGKWEGVEERYNIFGGTGRGGGGTRKGIPWVQPTRTHTLRLREPGHRYGPTWSLGYTACRTRTLSPQIRRIDADPRSRAAVSGTNRVQVSVRTSIPGEFALNQRW